MSFFMREASMSSFAKLIFVLLISAWLPPAEAGEAVENGIGAGIDETAAASTFTSACSVPKGTAFPGGVRFDAAVGTRHTLILSNFLLHIVDRRNCAAIRTDNIGTLLGLSTGTSLFSSKLIYDRVSKRFFLVAHTAVRNPSGVGGYSGEGFGILVSTDGTGTRWRRHRIAMQAGSAATNCIEFDTDPELAATLTSVGSTATRWLVTGRDYSDTGAAFVISIDKAGANAGQPVRYRCFKNLPDHSIAPMVLDRSSRATLLSMSPGGGGSIDRRDLEIGSNVDSDRVEQRPTYTIPTWTQARAIPRSARYPRVRMNQGDFFRPSQQFGGRIWNTHTIRAGTKARARVYELRTAATTTSTVNSIRDVCATSTCIDHSFAPSLALGNSIAPLFVTVNRLVPSVVPIPARRLAVVMVVVKPGGREYVTLGRTTSDTWPTNVLDTTITQIDPSSRARAFGWGVIFEGTKAADRVVRSQGVDAGP
jgi:hypothetical protein